MVANLGNMMRSDAFRDYEQALARLEDLKPCVARQTDAEAVFDAVQALQLAVARSYGGRRPRAATGQGARSKILTHLQERIGEWVSGEELAAVSGIGEWARRVRELRVEQGYRIEEQDGAYRLVVAEPDSEAARRWRILNSVRRNGGTAKEKVLALLSETVGTVVAGHQVAYVAKGSDPAAIARELRDEDGLPIDSSMDSRDLDADSFRLVSLDEEDRRDDRQRLFPEGIRSVIFQRDDYTCWHCRRDREAALRAGDRRFFIEVHHLHAEADNLDQLLFTELTDPASLATYCHKCLLEAHAEARRRRRWTDGSVRSGG